MELLTWREIKGSIQRKHGIEIDEAYDEQELIEMANRGIDKVEAKVITTNKDYFLDTDTIEVTAGQSEYDLPDNIYANKIRFLMKQLSSGSRKKVTRIKNLEDITGICSGDEVRYLIVNKGAGRKIKFYPTPTTSFSLDIFHTRNATRFTVDGGDDQVCDIPEFATAVMDYMSYLIEFKDKSPTMEIAKNEYKESEKDMIDSLASGVDDEDNEIEPDIEFYKDHA